MSVIFSEFQKNSKEQWIEKVKKDLRGKSIEELNWTLSKDLKFSPFFTKKDLPENSSSPIRSDNEWKAAEEFYTEEAHKSNKDILAALNQGISQICLEIKKENITSVFIENLLDGVQLEWVTTIFKIDVSHIEELCSIISDYCSTNNYSRKKVAWGVLLHSNNINSISNFSNDKFSEWPLFSFAISNNYSLDIKEDLEAWINIIDQLSQLEYAGKFKLTTRIGEKFYANIVKLKCISNYIDQSESLKKRTTLSVICDDTNYTDPNTNKIKATLKTYHSKNSILN